MYGLGVRPSGGVVGSCGAGEGATEELSPAGHVGPRLFMLDDFNT